MDNSDRPSYLLWPIRGGNGQFLLVDPWSGNYFDLEAAKFMEPIGIKHFFDAFSLDEKRPLKVDAASALRIPAKEVSDLLFFFGSLLLGSSPGRSALQSAE